MPKSRINARVPGPENGLLRPRSCPHLRHTPRHLSFLTMTRRNRLCRSLKQSSANPSARPWSASLPGRTLGIPLDGNMSHAIDTSTTPLTSWQACRMSPKEEQFAEEMNFHVLQQAWVHPSHSPCSSPILFVQKKDGSFQMCVNYRNLNS